MMKKIYAAMFLFLISGILCGCAALEFGPGPTDQKYAKAVEKLPAAKQAVYILRSHWHPNVVVGESYRDVATPSVPGTLFVTPQQLVFATYDIEADSFFQFYSANYSNITWMTPGLFGVNRIIRIRHDNSVHSFLFSSGLYKNNGEDADKDEVMNFILDKFKK